MRLCLIACGKNKKEVPSKASDLYTGSLFKKSKEWARRNADEWAILSAKFYLLRPETTVSPYNKTLNEMSKKEKEQWSKITCRMIFSTYPKATEFILLAGSNYRVFLTRYLSVGHCSVRVPMEGLGIGQQLAWLTKENEK